MYAMCNGKRLKIYKFRILHKLKFITANRKFKTFLFLEDIFHSHSFSIFQKKIKKDNYEIEFIYKYFVHSCHTSRQNITVLDSK